MLVCGAAAYALFAVAADLWVVGMPEGNRYVHLVILTLLGLAFVTAAEAFLAFIGAISPADMFGWPFRAAAIGSLAYSLAWAQPVFVNYWYYDDWGYLRGAPSAVAYLLAPLNDHFVPLLKIVILGMTRLFGFDYIGAACLQQSAFLIIVLVLAHLFWPAARRPWLLILSVGLFAMWPTYGVARTWFAGGFWLTASAGFLAVYILHGRRVIFGENMHGADVAVSFVLASATAFISSQTLAPSIYLAAFCLPPLLLSSGRSMALKRLAILGAVSLLPTAFALWGRSVYVISRQLNPSGLWNGALFVNLGAFFLNKVLLVRSFRNWRSPVELLVLVLLPMAAAAKRLAALKTIPPDRRAELAGLIVGGGAMLVLPIAQIGLGRRWSYDAALNAYYVTLPFLGLWLAWVGSGLAWLRGNDAAPARFPWSVALVSAILILAAGLSPTLHQGEPSLNRRIRIVHDERQFMDSLGAAVCDLARLHRDGPPVRWAPDADILSCRVCRTIIGPPQFRRDLGFDSLILIGRRRSCPQASAILTVPGAPPTDGSESPAAVSFLRTYFDPPH